MRSLGHELSQGVARYGGGRPRDSRPQRLKEVDTRYPGIAVYESVEDALADPSLDAMVIATPATTHYELVKKCLQLGKPVLVEKPITTNTEQAVELIELADSLELSLLVGVPLQPRSEKGQGLHRTG